jgi:hypothetical protein
MTNYTAPSIEGSPECIWAAEANLGEGTLWSQREQALYWIDILTPRLFWFRPIRPARGAAWQFDEEITAISERAEAPGLILTLRRGFALFDTTAVAGRRCQAALPAPARDPSASTTASTTASATRRGRFWGGSMDFDCKAPTGALYRYDADGRCTKPRRRLRGDQRADVVRRRAHHVLQQHGAQQPVRLRLRHGSRHCVEPPRVAPLSQGRRPARRHDHRRRRAPVDRALGWRVRHLPRPGDRGGTRVASHCLQAT